MYLRKKFKSFLQNSCTGKKDEYSYVFPRERPSQERAKLGDPRYLRNVQGKCDALGLRCLERSAAWKQAEAIRELETDSLGNPPPRGKP